MTQSWNVVSHLNPETWHLSFPGFPFTVFLTLQTPPSSWFSCHLGKRASFSSFISSAQFVFPHLHAGWVRTSPHTVCFPSSSRSLCQSGGTGGWGVSLTVLSEHLLLFAWQGLTKAWDCNAYLLDWKDGCWVSKTQSRLPAPLVENLFPRCPPMATEWLLWVPGKILHSLLQPADHNDHMVWFTRWIQADGMKDTPRRGPAWGYTVPLLSVLTSSSPECCPESISVPKLPSS